MMTTEHQLSLIEASRGIELWSSSTPFGSSFAVKTEHRRARLLSTLASAKAHFDDLVSRRRSSGAH